LAFREDQPDDCLLGMITAAMKVKTSSNDAQTLNLDRINPGKVIAEIAFLAGEPRTVRVTL